MDQVQTMVISEVKVDLVGQRDALEIIAGSLAADGAPLGVASINLDHIHHFGEHGAWGNTLGRTLRWLNLIDGAPIATQAKRITGRPWPRLAGSDLIGPILDHAEAEGVRVGFLGGSEETQKLLLKVLSDMRPALQVAGAWSPSRAQITDPAASNMLAQEIRAADVQLLVVGLGKPRQELWIEAHAATTGANVLLAFGAVVDFLAERIARAPRWAVEAGMEWAWRLALEPRRLAKRYLIQGPPAYLRAQQASLASPVAPSPHGTDHVVSNESCAKEPTARVSTGWGLPHGSHAADVTAVVVTYNNSEDIDGLIESLRSQDGVAIRVVVADNNSTDDTLDRLSRHRDITTVRTGGNLGYAAGINAAVRHAPDDKPILILNPDLLVEPGAVRALLDRLRATGAAIVAPRIVDSTGSPFPSLRREPTVGRAFGDAIFGSRWPGRPAWLSDTVRDPGHYHYAHPVDWASGAALLVNRDVIDTVGDWDETFFLYAEEVDYQHRVRAHDREIWYEPAACVIHRQGGSGRSPELLALMAVNRVRYFSKHRGAARARVMQGAVLLHESLRSHQPEHRLAASMLGNRDRWSLLPTGSPELASPRTSGSIIIPAYNEAAVIGRTLRSIASLLEDPNIEVIVVCNGTTDSTPDIARSFPGIRVIELAEASKVAALNAGDRAATRWPRLYLDADIEIAPTAVHALFDELNRRDSEGALIHEAARPSSVYDTKAASALVRAYYRARGRISSLDVSLWGAGAYALNEAGHQRFGQFPAVTADDLFVDRAIPAERKLAVRTPPTIVRTPRTSTDLGRILRRGIRASAELGGSATTNSTTRRLLSTVRGPRSMCDAAVYAGFAVTARITANRSSGEQPRWERDASSR